MPYKFGQPWTPVYQDTRLNSLAPPSGMFGAPPANAMLSAPRQTATSAVHDKAANALAHVVNRQMANRLANAVVGFTPVGALTGGFDAGADLRQGNYLQGGLGAALSVLPIPGPAKKFLGKGRAVVEGNDNNGLPDAMNSLASFLRDPRPLHQMYDVGDVLVHNGEVGEVVGASGSGLVLRTPSGPRVVPRNDPNLEPAPPHLWR